MQELTKQMHDQWNAGIGDILRAFVYFSHFAILSCMWDFVNFSHRGILSCGIMDSLSIHVSHVRHNSIYILFMRYHSSDRIVASYL